MFSFSLAVCQLLWEPKSAPAKPLLALASVPGSSTKQTQTLKGLHEHPKMSTSDFDTHTSSLTLHRFCHSEVHLHSHMCNATGNTCTGHSLQLQMLLPLLLQMVFIVQWRNHFHQIRFCGVKCISSSGSE